jgi:imidazolonepropionase-like amidohydrolase
VTHASSRFVPWIAAGLLLLGCKLGATEGVALIGATLIDGSGGPPLRNAVVLVRGGKVERVGSRDGFELPRGTSEVDVSGRWIIPGLIDAHAHASQASTWAPARYLAWE